MKTVSCDLAILGAGPGGYESAFYSAENGLKTVVIEKESQCGGTCLLRGCIPTKIFLHSADILSELEHAKRLGVSVGEYKIDLDALQKRKAQVISMQSKAIEEGFKKRGVELIRGFGKLSAQNVIRVEGEGGETTEVTAKNIMLATGSSVKPFANTQYDSKLILSSDDVLDFNSLPASLTIIGAGAVGVEFASAFARFGVKVTLIEALPHIVPPADAETAEALATGLRRQKINILEGMPVLNIRKGDNSVTVVVKEPDGKEKEVTAEKLLVAVGRKPNSQGIGLENAGIAPDERGFIKVDGYLKTNTKGIYAIGDIVPTPMLAHTASAEGILAVDDILGRKREPVNHFATPFCVYAKPEMAGCGYTEDDARKKFGDEIKIGRASMGANSKAAILNERTGLVKIIASKENVIIGAHAVGPQATEYIGELALAVANKMKVSDVGYAVHAHPTVYESIKFACAELIAHK